MDPKVLTKLLSQYGNAKQDGDKFLIPPTVTLTLFASPGESNLVVERVQELAFDSDVVCARTARDERYLLLCRDVCALRVTESKSAAGYGAR